MKAVVLNGCCEAKDLKLVEVDKPVVKEGWVVVKILGFGLNHSEVIFRQREVDSPLFKKPIIPGIECVGVIEETLDADFKKYDLVMALMGGMGRSFNGSYAEYALLPKKNVFKVEADLTLEELASIPETYYTAYGSLFKCLDINTHDTLLIRGGSSALGIAAIKLAKPIVKRVIVTTTEEEKTPFLQALGADKVIVDHGDFKDKMDEKVSKILELVGPKTLEESLKFLNYHGICCSTGILGGMISISNFDPIKTIPNGCYLTSFYSNYPTEEEIKDLFKILKAYKIKPYVAKVYPFKDIALAHEALEKGMMGGKGVVIVNGKDFRR